jgi:uncharacterized radical SAM superfamily Fe-S cluster-containing enzyme
VYLEKSCPEHGDPGRVLLWKNYPKTYLEWSRPGGLHASETRKHLTDAAQGCPRDCGPCPNHGQDTCAAVLEVTRRCDRKCRVCFAASEKAPADPSQSVIERMLRTLLDSAGPCPVQLSGGEPTLRNDLPQIVALARKMGLNHVQVNTNGIRIAEDADYAAALRDAGVSVIFLQFDGLSDAVYRRLRGAPLLDLKLRAIERCAELKLGVILVPTLARNVNEDQIGAILQFAKKWIPTVKGVHFQPMAYLGRYPRTPRNQDRVLISDVLKAIEDQTGGELVAENLIPSG